MIVIISGKVCTNCNDRGLVPNAAEVRLVRCPICGGTGINMYSTIVTYREDAEAIIRNLPSRKDRADG